MSFKLSDFRKLWKEELLEDVRREISGVIQPLKADLAAMNKKMNDLETSQKFLAEKYDILLVGIQEQKKQNKDSSDRMDGINTEVKYARNDIYDIQLRLDASEQYGRRDTLEIQGIPDIADDNPTQLVIETARLVDVELEPNDISIAHRLPSRNSQRQRKIIVKFTRRVKRDEVFNNRKKLKSKRSKDLPSVQIQSESSSVSHNAAIHINESLTPYRKRLFGRILDFKKNCHFKYLWTSNGKIMLRESDTSTTHSFVSFEEFDEFQDSLSQSR